MEHDTRSSTDGLMVVRRARLPKGWREEIELAVDAIKLEGRGRRTRDEMDRRCRHLWLEWLRSEGSGRNRCQDLIMGRT